MCGERISIHFPLCLLEPLYLKRYVKSSLTGYSSSENRMQLDAEGDGHTGPDDSLVEQLRRPLRVLFS